MIGAVGYSASYNSSIKSNAQKLFMAFKPEEKKEFETENKCCGFDVIQEGSPECPYKTPCGSTLEKIIQKYPQMAMTVSGIGACILVSHI